MSNRTAHTEPASKARILVVDDDDIVRGLHEAVLSLAGYETQSAENGEEALAMLGLGKFDLLVTDCNMPKLDCRRRYKSGILAGTKADRVLQRKSAENRGPNVGWRMFNDPEPEFWVVDEGDGGFSRACDLVVMALEIDGVVVVDATRLAEGEV